jgi:hypothetical protein
MAKPFRTKRAGLLAVGLVSSVGLLGCRDATAADADGPPADGKYTNVTVEGRVVPLIHVKEGGTIVLVDTDGKLPRTWEEMYKRHGGEGPAGTFNAHKTAPNGTDDFSTVPIDRKGNWIIDAKGNITSR